MTLHRKHPRRWGTVARQVRNLLDAGPDARLKCENRAHEAALRSAAWRLGVECCIASTDYGDRVCRVWREVGPDARADIERCAKLESEGTTQ